MLLFTGTLLLAFCNFMVALSLKNPWCFSEYKLNLILLHTKLHIFRYVYMRLILLYLTYCWDLQYYFWRWIGNLMTRNVTFNMSIPLKGISNLGTSKSFRLTSNCYVFAVDISHIFKPLDVDGRPGSWRNFSPRIITDHAIHEGCLKNKLLG